MKATEVEVVVPCSITFKVSTDADATPEMLALWLNENQQAVLRAMEKATQSQSGRWQRAGYYGDDEAVWIDNDLLSVEARVTNGGGLVGIPRFEWRTP